MTKKSKPSFDPADIDFDNLTLPEIESPPIIDVDDLTNTD